MGRRPKPKKKQVIHLRVRDVRRQSPSFNYLKFLKVARYWVRKKHGLCLQELEMLLFLRTEYFFTRAVFVEYSNIFGFSVSMFNDLLREGWVVKWRKEKYGEVAMYEVSSKGKRMLASFYKKLDGTNDYSTQPRKNPVFDKKNQSYTDKTMAMQMRRINELNRENRLKRVNYDWENPNS